MNATPSTKQENGSVSLGGFVAPDFLWEPQDGPASFASEMSARWYLRANRGALVECGAIMLHAGRLMVHPERFARAAEIIGLRAARERLRGAA